MNKSACLIEIHHAFQSQQKYAKASPFLYGEDLLTSTTECMKELCSETTLSIVLMT